MFRNVAVMLVQFSLFQF